MKQDGEAFLTKAFMAPLLMVSLLAACATAPEGDVRDALLPEEGGTVLAEDAAPENAAPVRRRPSTAGPRKPLPPLTLTSIVGRDEAGTVELLGQPARVRVESPATIWTYSRGSCDLEIYFYPSLRERRLQSLTYEISGQAEEGDCLKEFGLAENGTS